MPFYDGIKTLQNRLIFGGCGFKFKYANEYPYNPDNQPVLSSWYEKKDLWSYFNNIHKKNTKNI